jgi:polyribonucleotide nucleotidyltransferase
MMENTVTLNEQEEIFSKSYAFELRKKKQQINDNDRGFNELDDERRQIFQQAIRTPGRRGEIIKKDELEKEFVRRYQHVNIVFTR